MSGRNTSGDLYVFTRHLHVDLNYPAVSGSKRVDRDFTRARLTLLDPFGILAARRLPIPIRRIPAGKKWCSDHPTQGYVDPALLDRNPDRYWELQGWVDKDRFKPDKGFRDGLYPVCRDCRNRHDRLLYALMKAEQGKPVRPYRRRTEENKARSA